jgi:ubiquinone biosynthesis protein
MLDREYVPKPIRPRGKADVVIIQDVSEVSQFPVLQVLWRGLAWILTLVWLQVRRNLTQIEHGRRLRVLFETIGGLWFKVGQLISLRRDLFAPEFCSELAKLQDRAPGFSPEVAKQILADSLQAPVDQYFEYFDDHPIAAASIGQIHKARLRRENFWVVVKIQRPNIESRFQRDLHLIRVMVSIVDRLNLLSYLRLSDMVSELEHIAAEELDYRIEAANISRMRRTLRRHNIYVPLVVRRYSSRQVLVMEFIDGVLMSDFIETQQASPEAVRAWLHESDISTKKVAMQLFHSTLRQLFEDNLFHGDLHPGNIMLLRHNRIALIDFGAIGSLEVEYQKRYKLFVESLANGEYAKAVDFLFLISTLPPVDTNEVKQRIVRSIKAWELRTFAKGIPYREKSLSALMTEIVKILLEYRIWTDWAFMRIDRVTLSLDASLATLAPTANYPVMIRTYFRSLYDRELKEAREVNFGETVAKLSAAGSELVRMVAEVPVLREPMIRRAAQVFDGKIDNVAYLFVVVCRLLFWGTVLLEAFLVLCFALQHHRPLVAWILPLLGGGIVDAATRVPALGYVTWLATLAAIALFARMWARMKARFEKPDVRIPSRTETSLF